MYWISRHRYPLLAIVIALSIGIFTFGQPFMFALRVFMITPSGAFEDYALPPAPDYADSSWWAALPDRQDPADVSPAGLDVDRQSTAPADVFFVHPTTFITSEGWNQPTRDHIEANTMLNEWVLKAQASAFNGCCRVFAPRYRQATIASFLDTSGNGTKALELAYQDVVAAFNYYIENLGNSRPLIIAGHSQGAQHTHRLIREVLSEDLIRDRLVAAYTIGQPFQPGERLPVCETADQTGCQISWNSQTANARTVIGQPGGLCVNPLTWSTGEARASALLNLGSVDFTADSKVEQGVVDAQCKDGLLLLTEVVSENFAHMPFGPGNYHRYEFSLYYMNIRQNAENRVAAFLDR